MARPRSCRETQGSRNRGDAKKRPQKLARPNSVIATRERPAMKKIKVHSLTGRITSRLMRQAFQAVKRNRGAAGVDKISIQMFGRPADGNIARTERL